MYYRSGWPELGLCGPLCAGTTRVDSQAWLGDGTSKWRWVSKPDDFESRFYGIQIWNFHMEVLDTDQGWLAKDLKSALLFSKLQDMVQLFLQRAPWAHGYVATEVVYEEPLFQVLSEAGFEQVEHRCLYKSNVSQLRIPQDKSDHSIQYRSLAAIAANQRDRIREQILEICRESFHQGYSRHFSDRFLVQRAPGSAYILDVMQLNFARGPQHLILLAFDTESGRLCGFSLLSERPGRGSPCHTQLLSAVRNAYRGRGVYAGLTHLLIQTLPNEARLLNVTHAENHAMRRAYHNTGRQHYADTLVLRRIFGSPMQSGPG